MVSIPVFKLALVHARDDSRVVFPAGGEAERNLVDAIVRELEGRSLGYFRSQTVVTREVRSAVEAALYKFKAEMSRLA